MDQELITFCDNAHILKAKAQLILHEDDMLMFGILFDADSLSEDLLIVTCLN